MDAPQSKNATVYIRRSGSSGLNSVTGVHMRRLLFVLVLMLTTSAA